MAKKRKEIIVEIVDVEGEEGVPDFDRAIAHYVDLALPQALREYGFAMPEKRGRSKRQT